MDSDGPDLKEIVAAARDHAAYILLDCAHDLGIFGRAGTGLADEAGVLDEIDFIVGSFSKVLATTGGFMASRWRQCTLSVQAFGQSNTFSNQLGPIQAATALRTLEIVASQEGERLRVQVLATAEHFRTLLEQEGATCIGRPSALIPVLTGSEKVGREITRRLAEDGILVNFIEYPAVALGASRLRLQISPQHGALDLNSVAKRIGAELRSHRPVSEHSLTMA